MAIDLSINLGNIIAVGSVLLAAIAAYFDIRRILGDHESRVRLSEAAMLRQLEVNAQIAEALNLIRTDLAVIRVRAEKYEVQADKVKDVVKEQVTIVKEQIAVIEEQGKKVEAVAKEQEAKK